MEDKKINKISEEDRLTIELAKANRKVALANAEKALAQNEAAEAQYQNLILNVYIKYGLNFENTIDEQGNIGVKQNEQDKAQ